METPQVYSLINKAMIDIGAIGKDSTNQQQKFKYRGIDAVMNALSPAMRKHGLFVTPEVLDHKREERQTSSGGRLLYSILTMRYTMYAPDGSNVSAVVIGEGMDSGDKASNKAMSAAFKYAMFQLFCIPTDEMFDPDANTPENSKPAPQNNDQPKASDKHAPQTTVTTQTPEEARLQTMDTKVRDLKAKLRMSEERFNSCWKAVVDAGMVPKKKWSEMTNEEFIGFLTAIESNFYDRLAAEA